MKAYQTHLLRAATAADAAAVHAVTHEAFGAHPDVHPERSVLRESVDDVARDLMRDGGLLVQGPHGALLGAARLSEHDGGLWVRRVAVRAAARGQGVATLLVEGAEEEARRRGYRELRVAVRAPLRDVVAFWERRGFQLRAERDYWVELARPLAIVVEVPTDADMRGLGRRLAALARPGDLLVLSGDLGAGKTTLTQGIGEGLAVRGPVTSPTFVIARMHPALAGGPPLVHVDAYRLADLAEVDDLDLDASLDESVTVVEWGEGMVEGLSDERLEVVVRRSSSPDDETRTVRVRPVGARWAGVDV